jgi:hypothetical protein
MPLSWDDLEAAIARSSEPGLWFSPRRALERLDATGDRVAETQTVRQTLAATGAGG